MTNMKDTKTTAPAAGSTRRKFIGTAAAATAVSAVNLPVASCAQVAGSDELKLLVVGTGGRGGGAAEQALNSGGTRVVGMCDAFGERLEPTLSSLSQKFKDRVDVPDNRKFVGLEAYKEAIANTDANVVLLATPPGFRPYMFDAAV